MDTGGEGAESGSGNKLMSGGHQSWLSAGEDLYAQTSYLKVWGRGVGVEWKKAGGWRDEHDKLELMWQNFKQ